MKVEVLVASVNNNPDELVQRMNIQSDVIVANQTSHLSYEKKYIENHRYLQINTPEKGVGRNRNVALDRAYGDICILADDDQVFVDGYKEKIINLYKKYPKADVILFNVTIKGKKTYQIPKPYRVNYTNYMRFGAVRMSFRRKSVTKNNINFNLHFGGGTEHSAGEDVLFLHDCLKKKLKVVAVNVTLAQLEDNRPSTWFRGYNEKFFIDRGTLYATISPRFCRLYALSSMIRHRKIYKNEISSFMALKAMQKGIKNYKKSIGYI